MKFQQLKLWGAVLLTLLAFTLTACHKRLLPPPGPYHPLTNYQKALISQLRSTGVKVIKQGERLQIVIPTDRYFRPQTTQLRRSHINAAQQVAALVKSYIAPFKYPRIRVYGYTDEVYPRSTRRELSYRYAKVIADYLWSGGVSQTWVRVRGFSARGAIASNRTPNTAVYNRRVVVRIG